MAEDTRIGTQVAGYRIEELIGRGGMGAVYLARHLRLGRMVALKLLAPELAGNEKFRDRFLRESKLAASIDHPNIVPIYDADEADGVLFLAMRYVDGTDLRGLIVSEGRIDPPRTAAIAQQLGEALDVAHGHGLVHRDVKPANVLITPRHDPTGRDHVYLSDFGLTKRALSVSGLTQTGQIVGTIDYVAPEQVKGDPVDGRADQYSMGCLLYQCLTGSVPFPRDIEVAVLWAHVQDSPPSLADAGLVKQVDAAIGKAMAKESKDRYETCGELASALSEAVGVTSRPGRVRRVGRKRAPGRARGPAPVRLVRRHPAMTLLVALALIAAVALPATVALRSGGPGELIAGDAVAMVNLESGVLEGSVQLPSRPGAVATGMGSVWVTLPDRGAVIEIDAETRSIVDTVPVGSNPVGIAVGADSIWVANGGNATVSRITNNEVVDTIEVPGAPAAIAVNDQGVWVADSFGDAITPINAETDEVLDSVPVGDQPVDLADDGEELWVANAGSGSLSHVLAHDELPPVDVGEGPQGVAVGAEAVYAANFVDGTVSRIDFDTAGTEATRVGEGPIDLAFGGGFVWVSLGSEGSVKRIDPQLRSGTTIALGSYAGSVAVGDGALWVSVRGPLSAHRGGTLTVVAPRTFLDSIDPALAYSGLSWNILSLTNDGLVGLRRVGGVEGITPVPNLARSKPEAADGGKTYTFQLRPGVRYSSGDPIAPEDFRRAIERVYSLGSPGSFYFDTILGAAECRKGSCDLSAGIETDDDAGTVTFHLVEPDPDFLNKLTMSFAFAVPASTPDTRAGTTPIPATGPYMIERYNKGKWVVLVRNPEFEQWSADRPDGFPDRIVFRLDPDSDRQWNQQVDEVLEGSVDLMYARAERFPGLGTAHAGQLHSDPTRATRYMFLNVGIPPFDDERVRRALNYAVDRALIIDEVWGGAAAVRVTCQILPPTFPGYEPYCPYTLHPNGTWTGPDLAKAEELVEASGTAGARVTVWAAPTAYTGWTVPVGRRFVVLLKQLGYDARLNVVTDVRYDAATSNPSQQVQIGYLAFGPDYLAESGFIPALTCIPTGSYRVCNPSIERRMEQATSMQLTDPAASHDLWSDLEHDLVDLAPWVPLGNTVHTSLASERLGNYQYHPYWGQLFDLMWVR